MSIVIPDPAVTNWVPLSYGASIQTNVPTARVYRTGTPQSVVNGTWTPIQFDTERWDTDNIYDSTTNPTYLTCRTAGKYLVAFTSGFTANVTNVRGWGFRVNGSVFHGISMSNALTGTNDHHGGTTVVLDLAVGDYVECIVIQWSGGALNVIKGAQYSPEAQIAYIGPGLTGRGITNLTGTYLLRPAANTVPQGTTYFATDTLGTWLSDGVAWTLVNQRAPMIVSATMSAAPFTTPYDGQEITLTDSLTSPTYDWRFRYNAGSGSTYKWEFVGGAPQGAYLAASAALVVGWNPGQPSIVVARAGEYLVSSAAMFIMGPLVLIGIGAYLGAGGPYATTHATPSGAYWGLDTNDRFVTLTTPATVYIGYYLASGAMNAQDRRIGVLPIRVS